MSFLALVARLPLLALLAWLSLLAARSLSRPLQNIAARIGHESNEQLEILAGNVKEFNQLVEGIQKTKNLFTNSLDELERQKLEFPVICGGAALTRKYVEDDLRREYSNAVFYADDAFGGLHIMEDLASPDGKKETRQIRYIA